MPMEWIQIEPPEPDPEKYEKWLATEYARLADLSQLGIPAHLLAGENESYNVAMAERTRFKREKIRE